MAAFVRATKPAVVDATLHKTSATPR